MAFKRWFSFVLSLKGPIFYSQNVWFKEYISIYELFPEVLKYAIDGLGVPEDQFYKKEFYGN